MDVRRRYLVKEKTGRLVELPSHLLDRADDGTQPLPDYAGRCLEVVAAVVVVERGTPPRLAEMSFTKLYFDQSGFVDAAKRERMIRLMLESCADRHCSPGAKTLPEGHCATLSRKAGAARDQLMREFGWNPRPAELDAALFRLDQPQGAGQGAGQRAGRMRVVH